MIIFVLTGLAVVLGLGRMLMYVCRFNRKECKDQIITSFGKSFRKVLNELFTMKRYHDCENEEGSYWYGKPQIIKPWFVHWSIMWGFLGLLLATILDFIFKDPATTVWYPSRILGTITGLLLMYGTTLAIIYRIKKPTKAYADITLSDWMFLVFLWLAGFTGFWLEVAVMFNHEHMVNHGMFVFHTIISMELVLLFTFSKFAHAVYRPLALLMYYRRTVD
jgi:hypothetical protein